jgi:hypothetical protein
MCGTVILFPHESYGGCFNTATTLPLVLKVTQFNLYERFNNIVRD